MARKGRRSGTLIDVDGDGRHWVWKLTLGLDESGKRPRVQGTIWGSRRDAERALDQARRAAENGTASALSERMTLDQWRAEWLKLWCDVAPRTLHDYRTDLDRYLTPELRYKKLRTITRADVKTWVDGLTAANGEPLAARTVRKVFAALRACLSEAERQRKIAHNPASKMKLKRREALDEPPARGHALTEEEIARFLVAAEGSHWEALFVLMATAGLRPGEALALRWSDLNGDRLRIERAVVRAGWGKGSVTIGPTKTRRVRTARLTERAIAALQAHRQRQEQWCREAKVEPHGMIFPNQEGKIPDDRKIRDLFFRPILAKAGLPPIRMYDLRGTAGTQAYIKSGYNLKAAMDLLGDSTPSLVLNTYIRLSDDSPRDVAERVNAGLDDAVARVKRNQVRLVASG